MYLCFRSTCCQNIKTIVWPPAEISVIEKKQRMSYGFHSKNFRKRKFCSHHPNAWAFHSWKFRQNRQRNVPYECCLRSWQPHDPAQTLLDYIRKSISLRKRCSEHKMYLCFRSTHCQNFKTIARPSTEISVIEEKQRISYGFHSNNFRKTKFCDQLPNAWALNFWRFRQNPASRSWVINERKSN